VSQKVTLSFLINVHFFCSSKRNEPKKRRPEKITSPVCRLLRYAIFRSNKHGEVRTFSGLPSHLIRKTLYDEEDGCFIFKLLITDEKKGDASPFQEPQVM
jgi:hypothetical protein